MRHAILAIPALCLLVVDAVGGTWYLQGTGVFSDATRWRYGSNGGTNGVPGALDNLQFYGGGGVDPMVNADVTLTLTNNQTVALWNQKYGNATVRVNLGAKELAVTNAAATSSFHLLEGDTGNKAYVYGGGRLLTHGLLATGYKAGGLYLSGGSRLRFLSGGTGIGLGGGYNASEEVRLEVTGGAGVRNDLAWSPNLVGFSPGIAGRGYATVYLSDSGSQMLLNSAGPFVFGVQGRGQLVVTNGAMFYSGDLINLGGYMYESVAYNGTLGHGTVRVDGSGSTFEATAIYAGMFSTGVVQVVRGGYMYGTDMVLGAGYNAGSPGNGTNLAAYGTLTIAHTNSRVELESLKVGDMGRGEVLVTSNAVLAVTGPVTVRNSRLAVSDAVVSVGGPAGTLTTTGSSNVMRFELGSRDRVIQTAYIKADGAVSLGAGTVLELSLLGNFSALTGDQIRLIDGASLAGSFSNYPDQTTFVMGEHTFKITYARTGVYLTALSAPAPVLNCQQTVNGLVFSWSQTGFKLQAQTNATGLGTNWHDYPGGGTSPVTIPIDPANPTAFFRLKEGITAADMFKNWIPSVYYYGGGMRSNVTKAASGNSLIVTAYITNTSTIWWGEFGGFTMPEMNLGTSDVYGYDFEGSGVLVPLSTAHSNEQIVSRYPWCYSPLLVVKKGEILISFSFHYPVLSYKHDTKLAIKYVGNGKWQPSNLNTFFDYPGTPYGAYHSVSAQFAPGMVRKYELVITTGSTLAEVVAPYKAYFDSLYPGGKQYSPSLGPITGLALAAQDTPGFPTTNPYGWYPDFTNAHTRGFQTAVVPEVLKWIRGAPGDYNRGNDNFLIWTPTGVVEGDMEYPFIFTSKWADFTGGLSGTIAALQTLTNSPGRHMGFWWGHSLEYQPNWNSTNGRTELDCNNPAHRALGHQQMTNALAAGASFIGLDASAHGLGMNPNTGTTDGRNQVWYFLPWIQQLKASYPGIKFITEGMASDILHRETATYLEYWGLGYTKRIHGRHLLADILLPGSEVIGAIIYDVGYVVEPDLWHGQPFWAPINEQTRLDVVRTTIDYGYVPLVFYRYISLKNDL